MAFKPFEIFRKRQKTILAILAIMAMFLFVIGDAVSMRGQGGSVWGKRISRLFGNSESVGVVTGKQYDAEELDELFRQRFAAYRLVGLVFGEGMQRLQEEQTQKAKEKDKERDTNPLNQSFMKRFQMESSLPFQMMESNPSAGKAETMIEFLLWKKKADELGIVVSPARVKEMLLEAGGGYVKGDELTELIQQSRNLGHSEETLLGWLGDELRVMIARNVVLNNAPFTHQSRASQPTPFDLWQAYVDLRTQLEVGVLPIAVNQKDFLAKVPEPTAEELRKFYDQYKSQEPDPVRDTPGFRIPKLFKVEFVYGQLIAGTDPWDYYMKWQKAAEALAPLNFLGEVVDTYNIQKNFLHRSEETFIIPVASKPEDAVFTAGAKPPVIGKWPTIERVNAQGTALAAAQQMLAIGNHLAIGPGGSFFVPSQYRTEITKMSRTNTQAVFAASAVLAASSGLPALMTVEPKMVSVVKYKPLTEVFDSIALQMRETRMAVYLQKDLSKLKDELKNYAKKYNAKRAQRPPGGQAPAKFEPPPFDDKTNESLDDYVKRWAKTRGLVFEGMAEPRSKLELFKEGARTPLRSILLEVFRNSSPGQAGQMESFGKDQIVSKPLFDASEISAPLTPHKQYALYWKTQETDARTPEFNAIKDNVTEAWKLVKARELAEEQAKAIVAEVKKDGAKILMDRFKDGYQPDKLLSRFEKVPPLGIISAPTFRLATPPVVEHPVDGFLDTALAELKQPGDVFYVTNKPKSHYYVFVLHKRTEPNAAVPVDLGEFDQLVMLPDLAKQLKVIDRANAATTDTGISLSQYVTQKRSDKFQKEWTAFLKDETKFNAEFAKGYDERVKSRRD